MGSALSLIPMIGWPWLAAGAALLAGLTVFGLLRRIRGTAPRALAGLVILVALADPRLIREEGRVLPDTVLVVVDRSASQSVGDRPQATNRALVDLTARLNAFPTLEARVVEASGTPDGGTRLFEAITQALTDVPKARLSSVILLTDGLVHDIPADLGRGLGAPVHVLLTGRPSERDRRIIVDGAAYGLVGRTASLRFTVEDNNRDGDAEVRVRLDGKPFAVVSAPLNRQAALEIPVNHPGPVLAELEAEAAPDELTLANNRTVATVTGVRDRLKVLLVSGEPHGGVRAWRNLLKSDPAVDLVHFTILRPPEKDDPTPVKDLSLIAFPVRELFEEKLPQFDLVILDRYRGRGLLAPAYSRNLAEHVRKGGALMVSLGPEAAEAGGLLSVPALAELLPTLPSGKAMDAPFHPQPSRDGQLHPVTGGLPDAQSWGPWLRRLEAGQGRGTVLLQEGTGRPLLLVDKVGEGRVALLLTDSAWTWARGFEGGGPHDMLFRRLAHWLMKEPELEEESLRAEIAGDTLTVIRRSMSSTESNVRVTGPEGKTANLVLTRQGDGSQMGRFLADHPGLWRAEDQNGAVALAAKSGNDGRELAELAATDRLLRPVVQATGGTISWLSQGGLPTLRRSGTGGTSGPISLPIREMKSVEGLSQLPLFPPWALLGLGFAALVAAWRRESVG